MDLELVGRVALVTGGSRGIGKPFALELAREGGDVAVCARDAGALNSAASELAAETGRRVVAIAADTSDGPSVERLAESTASQLGGIDILVNCAATLGGLVQGDLADSSDDALLQDINTKVVGYTFGVPRRQRPTCVATAGAGSSTPEGFPPGGPGA